MRLPSPGFILGGLWTSCFESFSFQKNCGYFCCEVKKRSEFIYEGPSGFWFHVGRWGCLQWTSLIGHDFQALRSSLATTWVYVEPDSFFRVRSRSRHVNYMLKEEILKWWMNEWMHQWMNASSNLRYNFQVDDFHPSSSFDLPLCPFLVAASKVSIPWGRGTWGHFSRPGTSCCHLLSAACYLCISLASKHKSESHPPELVKTQLRSYSHGKSPCVAFQGYYSSPGMENGTASKWLLILARAAVLSDPLLKGHLGIFLDADSLAPVWVSLTEHGMPASCHNP